MNFIKYYKLVFSSSIHMKVFKNKIILNYKIELNNFFNIDKYRYIYKLSFLYFYLNHLFMPL